MKYTFTKRCSSYPFIISQLNQSTQETHKTTVHLPVKVNLTLVFHMLKPPNTVGFSVAQNHFTIIQCFIHAVGLLRLSNDSQIQQCCAQISGAEPTEASATLKYNGNTLDTEINIPDFDLEAGIKLAVTDSMVEGTKMRGITVDVTNKNIPQFTLIGRVR